MIYLIFDTNIWIYLANGLDTKSGKYHDNHHFVLLHKLIELHGEGDICILVNELIIDEWKRNKKNTETKIEQLQSKLQSLSPIKELSKYVITDLSIIKEKYIAGINADRENETLFHPDILAELNGFPLQYYKRLPEALELSEEIIKDIDSYNQNKIVHVEPIQCLMAYCRFENVVFDDEVKVVYEIDINLDPNQLSLFPQTIKRTRRAFVQGGICPHCETMYYQCPKCLEVSYVNDYPTFQCFHCPTELAFSENRSGQWELIVYNSFSSSIERKEKIGWESNTI